MKFLEYFKSSKFYWFLGLGIFIILATLMGFYGADFNLLAQYIMAFLIASSWSVSLILSMLKRSRPRWWVGAIASFWVGFVCAIFSIWTFVTIATILCIVFAGIAYLDFIKNGPYEFKK